MKRQQGAFSNGFGRRHFAQLSTPEDRQGVPHCLCDSLRRVSLQIFLIEQHDGGHERRISRVELQGRREQRSSFRSVPPSRERFGIA